MAGILVVYFSRTGNTRKVAEEIARQLGADVERVAEVVDRVSGGWGYLRACWQSLRKQPAQIKPPVRDPADYELIILGTPVWASAMSSPMRSYILGQSPKFGRIAVFCTLGGNGGAKTLGHMAELCGKQSVAAIEITQAELGTDIWKKKVARFIRSLPAPQAAPARGNVTA